MSSSTALGSPAIIFCYLTVYIRTPYNYSSFLFKIPNPFCKSELSWVEMTHVLWNLPIKEVLHFFTQEIFIFGCCCQEVKIYFVRLDSPAKFVNWKWRKIFSLNRGILQSNQSHCTVPQPLWCVSIVGQDMMIWNSGKLQSHKIEDLCLMLNCISNLLSQLH